MIDGLTPRHVDIALLWLIGATDDEIAEQAGVSPGTVRALTASPAFQVLAERVRQRQQADAVNRAVTKLTDSLPTAADALALASVGNWKAASNLLDRHPSTARVTRGRTGGASQLSTPVRAYIKDQTQALPANAPSAIAVETLDQAIDSVSDER